MHSLLEVAIQYMHFFLKNKKEKEDRIILKNHNSYFIGIAIITKKIISL